MICNSPEIFSKPNGIELAKLVLCLKTCLANYTMKKVDKHVSPLRPDGVDTGIRCHCPLEVNMQL